MAILSQGSQVFALAPSEADPEVLEVLTVSCATAFTPGGNPADQIETTCLEDSDRQYLPGLRTPASATLTVNFDPSEPSHVRLFELAQMNPPPTLQWALGWSDGPRDALGENTSLPTLNTAGDDFELPDDRTWFLFDGYLSDVPFDFASNTVVTSAATIQRTGPGVLVPKETP